MNTEKKKLDHISYADLEEGVYELEKTEAGIFYIPIKDDAVLQQLNEKTGSMMECVKQMNQMEGEHYLMEKRHGEAVLFFPRVVRKNDFMENREKYAELIASFANFTDSSPTSLIMIRPSFLFGLSTFSGDPKWRNDFICIKPSFTMKPYYIFAQEYAREKAGEDTTAGKTDKAADKNAGEKPFVSCVPPRYAERNKSVNLAERMQKALERLTPKAMLSYCERRIQGQGIQLKKAVYLVYRYLLNIANNSDAPAENWMLTAPSGSGKTEFFRAVRDCFQLYNIPVPVVQIDLSQITEAGYKGENVKTIPQKILRAAPNMGGVAICFLDEADKKFVHSYGSHNVDNNAAVQSNLLTLVEGMQMTVDVDDVDKSFDSEKTMFVFMGSFQSLRDDKQEKKDKAAAIGFRADFVRKENVRKTGEEFYEDLTLQDMIDFGMLEELAGRMVQVINFRKLSQEHMRELIADKIEEISDELGVAILFTDHAVEELLELSFGSLGVRRPMNIVRELVSNAIAEFFFDDGFDARRDQVLINSLEDVKFSKTVHKASDVQAVFSCEG